MDASFFENARLIMYHKHHTSARTLFLKLNDTICAFSPLPSLSQINDSHVQLPVVIHPAALIAHAEKLMGLENGLLEIDNQFQEQIDVSQGPITVYLARFTSVDPPHELVAMSEGRFIALTEARQIPPTELELLRRAYAAIMEG